MLDEKTLWDIEEGFWLKGRSHYEQYLHPDCLFALPEPTGLMRGNGFVSHLPENAAFAALEMTERSLSTPTPNVAVLAYSGAGSQNDGIVRHCLCTSTYVTFDGQPKLIQHQQTPVLSKS